MQQKTNENKKRVNRIRSLLQKRVLEKRRNFYQIVLVRNAKHTTKTFFNTIKSLGGDTKIKQQAVLMQEGTENFNKFFTSIRKTSDDKLVTERKNNTKNGTVSSIFLHTISKKELSVAIRNLKNKYSSDFDGLNSFILKKIQLAFVPSLTYLVNKCFENCVFPNCLKEAVIISLYKKKSLNCWKLQTNQFAANNRKTDWVIGSEKNSKFFGKIQPSKQKSIWI